MKKQAIWILLSVEVFALALLLGFFLGRNSADSPVQISKLPDATSASSETEPEETIGKININTAVLAAGAIPAAITGEMIAVGSLLVLAIGTNLLGITKIKVMNYTPAMFFPIALCPLFQLLSFG